MRAQSVPPKKISTAMSSASVSPGIAERHRSADERRALATRLRDKVPREENIADGSGRKIVAIRRAADRVQ